MSVHPYQTPRFYEWLLTVSEAEVFNAMISSMHEAAGLGVFLQSKPQTE